MTSDVRIFLGGPAGAGKTTLTKYLVSQGWYDLDFDGHGTDRVIPLLDAPPDHPAFHRFPLVAEGGFLDEAPLFQDMIDRFSFTTFWLTGTKSQLVQSRLNRMASWDDAHSIQTSDWIGLIEKHRQKVRWDHEIPMWDQDGKRKSFDRILLEIRGKMEVPQQ